MNPKQAGDEPYLIASKLKGVPVLVGKNRYRMGRAAINQFDVDVIVLDDGFQHIGLKRDLDILLLDDRRPFGNRHLLPRGTLRESPSALARSDVFVLTRSVSPTSVSFDAIRRLAKRRPVFKSYHKPGIRGVVAGNRLHLSSHRAGSSMTPETILSRRPVFAFSGIGKNTDFCHTVRLFGCELKGFMQFPDHHFYSSDDIDRIQQKAMDSGAEMLVTTEKDYVRIMHRKDRFLFDVVVVGIETTFSEDADGFYRFLESRLRPKMDRSK
jgi:tetraacyldisaccharide 4'-kinase